MLMKVAGIWRRRLDPALVNEDDWVCFTAAENAKLTTFLEQHEGDTETRKRVRFAGHIAHRQGKKGAP
jgi:hypothetical protein